MLNAEVELVRLIAKQEAEAAIERELETGELAARVDSKRKSVKKAAPAAVVVETKKKKAKK